jgi:hypothetical protein
MTGIELDVNFWSSESQQLPAVHQFLVYNAFDRRCPLWVSPSRGPLRPALMQVFLGPDIQMVLGRSGDGRSFAG